MEAKGSVLIVDEAQVIQNDRTLEELRMLLNLQSNNKFLVNGMMEYWNIGLKLSRTTLNHFSEESSAHYSIIPVFHPSKSVIPSHPT